MSVATERARILAQRIVADAVADTPWRVAFTPRPQGALSLSGGRAGHAYLYTELGRLCAGDSWFDAAESALADAVAALPTVEGSLYPGIAGFALSAARFHAVTGRGAKLRDALLRAVVEFADRIFAGRSFSVVSYFAKYELIAGVSGVHLAAARLELRELTELSRRYLRWYAAYPALHAIPVADDTTGAVNIGMSHGLAGMLAVLAITDDVAECAAEVLPLARALASTARRPEGLPRWDYYHRGAAAFRPARSAWCYGNPGIAAALALVGERYQAPDLVALACEALDAVIALDRRAWALSDDAICHGTAGVALCFETVGRVARDERLVTFAHELLEETAARYDSTVPFGYRAEVRGIQYDDGSLLTGTCGIALAQLSAEPSFDRDLLNVFGLR
jgi:lantibiotic modifying enzyme